MTQAKGILPTHGDRDVLRDPRSCGYFVAVTFVDALDREGAQAWLTALTPLVDELVAPHPPEEPPAGAVAVGLAAGFFLRDGQPRFQPALQVPAGFSSRAVPAPPGQPLGGDALLYLVSPYEARANAFISAIAAHPAVTAVRLLRGYQRIDGTEPFGYADGRRNVEPVKRPVVVFVHGDRHLEEPEGAFGGSYMAYMRIVQHPEAFAQIAPDAQDEVIGRKKDGARLDLVGRDIPPREEPPDPPDIPQAAHVAKVGPRGRHDDTHIFRRGLPFMDTTPASKLEVGLNFCSFQASLDQFDVVLGDWALNPAFAAKPGDPAPGVDALLDPARGLTEVAECGLYFVPPVDDDRRFIGATLFDQPPDHRAAKTGHLAVLKRVRAANDPAARFERGGFSFQVIDVNGQPVGEPFTTDSTGRAIFSGELQIGQSYALREVARPQIPNLQPAADQPFTMDTPRKVVRLDNIVSQPGGYGAPA
jgi:deferrochelatase/peroxidase EfeB